MTNSKDLILASQKYHKGWYTLYHSKGTLKKEWLAAASANDKTKAIEMLEKHSK